MSNQQWNGMEDGRVVEGGGGRGRGKGRVAGT